MRLRALVALVAALGTVALAGCSTGPDTVEETQEAERVSYSCGEMSFTLSNEWELSSSDGYHTTYELMSGNDVMARVVASNVDFGQFHADVEQDIKYWLDSASSDGTMTFAEPREIEGTETTTYASAVTVNTDPELSGMVLIKLSGEHLYMMNAMARTEDYDDYSDELNKIIESVAIEDPRPLVQAAPESATANPTVPETETQQTPQTPQTPSMPTSLGEGTYLVGTDIQAGEYKLTGTSSDGSGYWEVKNSSAPDADRVGNDFFKGTSYVTVSDGQYLTLSNATAEQVQ